MMPMVYMEGSRIGNASGHEQEAHAEHETGQKLSGSGPSHRGLCQHQFR